MDIDGVLLSQGDFQIKYAVKCNFLHIADICEAVRDVLSKFNFPHFSRNIPRPYLPVFLVTLLKSRSGTKSIYDPLVKKEISTKAVKNGRLN